jgi:thiol-disulfide isomerase/thioredoxin
MTGVYVVAAATVLAVVFGLYRALTDGRVRGARRRDAGLRLGAEQLGEALGGSATFVQFSSAVCAPCRATKRLLADVVKDEPSVAHVELDAETRLDLVEKLNITRTPTVVLLDKDGVVKHRIVGTPRKHHVLHLLHEVLGRPATSNA